jgi:hypothetical protein
MRPCKEVTQIDKFAMIFILNIDHTPAVLATTNLLATNDNGLFTPYNGKWNNVLLLALTKVP